MLMRLMRYNLEVKYTPGSKMYIADTLSRACDPSASDKSLIDEDNIFRVHSVTVDFPASPKRLQKLREATALDSKLQKLIQYTKFGWPRHKGSVDPHLLPYYPIRDEIFEERGLLFVSGNRMIVPRSERREILMKLHEGHSGMEKSKSRLRATLFWPNMNQHVEDMIRQCTICAAHSKSLPKQPMICHDIPDRPWAKLGADLFECHGNDYLIVVDYFSKYPEVIKLNRKNATAVITALKTVFARHGIPDEFVSDNVPFGSAEFREFADTWNFKNITSSPRYPRSNGQAERFVGTVKSMLTKTLESGKDYYMALLQYRNTPISGSRYSPAELLFSRKLNDITPTANKLLRPKLAEKAKDDLTFRQWRQKRLYDKTATARQPLQLQQKVRVQLDKTWEPAIVKSVCPEPRSYQVELNDGRKFRRNESFIKPNFTRDNTLIHINDFDGPESVNSKKAPVPNRNVPESDHNENRCLPNSVENPNENVRRTGRSSVLPARFQDFVVDIPGKSK